MEYSFMRAYSIIQQNNSPNEIVCDIQMIVIGAEIYLSINLINLRASAALREHITRGRPPV